MPEFLAANIAGGHEEREENRVRSDVPARHDASGESARPCSADLPQGKKEKFMPIKKR